MSTNELKRAGVLARVAAKTLTLGAASVLMAVSYRQAKRLYRRYRTKGAAGLRHGNAGRASNRATSPRVRRRVLALVREKYGGANEERFGPTLAAEHLASEDGLTVDQETLRRWMLAAGLWSRARKRSPHRRRRARMAHFGELVQLDGSFHPWFEARGPSSCLLTLVDDATGRSLGRFGAQETIWAAVAVLRRWIEAYGIPRALYTDWKNVYVRVAESGGARHRRGAADAIWAHVRDVGDSDYSGELAAGQGPDRTESRHPAGSAGQEAAASAASRIVDAANVFLETAYWADHNARFAQAPASADDFHVARAARPAARQVFRLEETRTVSNDWVVRYDNRLLAARAAEWPARRRAAPCWSVKTSPGTLEIRYRDRVMRWTEIGAGRGRPRPARPFDRRTDAPSRPPRAPRRSSAAPRRITLAACFRTDGARRALWQLVD